MATYFLNYLFFKKKIGAGTGDLALDIEGPSKANITSIDTKDGKVHVFYLPTAPGEYKITARFAGDHIEGSPFTCKVESKRCPYIKNSTS